MAGLSHSDSESEDHNKDPLDDDRDVLREEEEREKLLTTSKSFKDGHHEEGDGDRKERRRSRRREQKKRKKPGNDRERTALYKMEEGGRDSCSQLSSRSSMESLSGHETASSRTRVCFVYPRSLRRLIICSDCESKFSILLSSP